MNRYDKRKLDVDVDELPFRDFFTSRHSMTVRVEALNTYEYSKEHDLSFFNLTVACILEALNDVVEFKRRIIDGCVYEYDMINAVCPILQDDFSIREIEIKPASLFDCLFDFNLYVDDMKNNVDDYEFLVDASLRDSLPICNLSCMPWIDFDSMTNVIASSNQVMPVITWGKFVDGKIPISLTASHMFVFGYHFKLFYEKVELYLANPELVIR